MESQREKDRVAVVGGGLSGLTTAVALQRRLQLQVEVFESSSQQEFENIQAGAAVQLTPNGLEALREAAGDVVLQRVLKNSSQVTKTVMILPPSQQSNDALYDNLQTMQESTPSPVNGFPTVMIRWGLLRQFLAHELAPGSILFNQQVTGYQRDEQDNKIRLQLGGGNLSEHSYSLAIAADGSKSKFRPTPLQEQPRLNLKAVVAKRPLDLPECHKTAYSLFLQNGIALFCGPASPQDWTYWAISLPLQDKENRVSTKAQLLQELQPHGQTRVFTELIQATDESRIFIQTSSSASLPQQLAFDSANVVLVGDAAHAMSASYGQATSFGFEDAATLAHCLSLQRSSKEAALQHFSMLRHARCVQMQVKSQERYSNRNKNNEDTLTGWIHDWTLTSSPPPQDAQQDTHMAVVG